MAVCNHCLHCQDQNNRLDRDGISKSESGDLGLTPFPGARRGPAGHLLRPGLPLCFPSNPGAQSGVEIHSTGDGLGLDVDHLSSATPPPVMPIPLSSSESVLFHWSERPILLVEGERRRWAESSRPRGERA